MTKTVRALIRLLLKLMPPFGYGALGALLTIVTVFVLYLENRADLSVWHHALLESELGLDGKAETFQDYLELESQVFAELEQDVLDQIEPGDQTLINRYSRGSLSDPGKWPTNWNRTFELDTDSPRVGVLLLHGMSDSPYSLRRLGDSLNRAGAHVVGLRLPGHGTAPSGLVELRWEHMAAASDLALVHLRQAVGDLPVYVIGYSTGAGLAVENVLRAMERGKDQTIEGLVLISPAIGVSPMAAFAVWQGRLGHLLGLDKLAWTDISPEYDPFKYSSFAVNAGDQVYRLTAEIGSRLDTLGSQGRLQGFPAILAFQSAVDATVSTRALIAGLFEKLPAGSNELVLFDINRTSNTEAILEYDPASELGRGIDFRTTAYDTTLITNESDDSAKVVVLRRAGEEGEFRHETGQMFWPAGVYSLSHVALPVPKDDPLYGIDGPGQQGVIRLGRMEMRGERGVLRIPASAMLRQRWNPFFPYLEARTLQFLGLSE